MPKKSQQFIIACIVLFSFTSPGNTFAILQNQTSSDEASQALEFLREKKADSVSKQSFNEEDRITQSDLINWLLRSVDFEPNDTEKKAKSKCRDVKDINLIPYFNKAIEVGLLHLNATKPDCKPEKTISRIEALKSTFFLYGIPTPKLNNEKLSYKDVDIDAWFYPILIKNEELKLIGAQEDDYFRPYAKTTNIETALLLFRVFNYVYKQNTDETLTETPSENVLSEIPKSEIFIDVWNKILNDYYYKKQDGFSENDLIYNAIQGLIKTTSDPFTEFYPPTTKENITESLNEGAFEGIGAQLTIENNKIIIISVIKDGPAEKEGLKVKDEVLEVDNKSIKDMALEDIVALIKGSKGTKVTLTIYRDSEKKQFDLEITRDVITLTFVEPELLSKDIGMISIAVFGENTAADFVSAVENLKTLKIKGLIIDLRNNPGGYLDSVLQILEHFLTKNKALVGVKFSNGTVQMYVSEGEGELSSMPIMVLVNEGSASASEIMASTLKEHRAATIIGTTTFGKGTVQELEAYDDGSSFKVTVAEWLTPNLKSINHVGVKPDITVEISSEDIQNSRDPQLDRAMEEIEKELK